MLERVDLKARKISKEEYKPTHDELISKLVVLQQQARSKGVGLVVLVEGWSGAGKGSRISELIYELDARATRVHVTEDINPEIAREFPGVKWDVKGENPLMKQFWESLGERGEITFYDRGWYTSAVEQALFGLTKADPKEIKKLTKKVRRLPANERAAAISQNEEAARIVCNYRQIACNFEKMLIDDGYIVAKLFLHISKEEQRSRLEALRKNPDTAWRVSKQKLKMMDYYDEAYGFYDELLTGSDFRFAPWVIINGEDRRAANLQIAQTLVDALERALSSAPDEAAEEAKRKAAENSKAADGAGNDTAEAEPEDAAAKAYEEQAAAQSALAPKSSFFEIVENYPQIDHSKEKPRIETQEEYRKLLKKEQARFRKLQEEAYRKRVPLMIMYEGWDAAGKGGNIKRIAQAIDARAYRIYPSPAPSKADLAHPHLWRYWTRMPEAGYVGIYDRSWYGRVLVERVEGFASTDQWSRAYDEINAFEYQLVQWGAILLKFWVDITPDEQLARFEARAADPIKTWKLTDEDWRNRDKYPLYKAAVNDMFRLTSTEFAPWTMLESDSKWYARIQALEAINEALEARLHK